MEAPPLFSPEQIRQTRLVIVPCFGVAAVGVIATLVTYPSWQLALSAACMVTTMRFAWVAVGAQLAPLIAGVPASAYLRSGVPVVLTLVLFSLGAWMLSLGPMN